MTDVNQRLCGSVGVLFLFVYLLFLVAHRVLSPAKETRTCRWRLHVGSSFISLFSLNYVRVFFSNGSLMSVCGKQPIVLAIALLVWGFPWNLFGEQFKWIKNSLGTRSKLVLHLLHYLGTSLGLILYIYGVLIAVDFHTTPEIPLILAVLLHLAVSLHSVSQPHLLPSLNLNLLFQSRLTPDHPYLMTICWECFILLLNILEIFFLCFCLLVLCLF